MVDNNQKVKSRWTRTFFTALNRRNDDERYVCDMCNKDFASPSSMALHRNTHVIERRYKCEPCQVSFHSQGHLQKHVRSTAHETRVQMTQAFGVPTSDNPRPYGCPECNVAFRKHGHLAKHLRSKSHITKMESNGLVPVGTYATFERCSPEIRDRLVTTNYEQSLQSLLSIVMQSSQTQSHSPGELASTSASSTSSTSSSAVMTGGSAQPSRSSSSSLSCPPMITLESRSSSLTHCSPYKVGLSVAPLSNMSMTMPPNMVASGVSQSMSPVACSSGFCNMATSAHTSQAATSILDTMAPTMPIFNQRDQTPPLPQSLSVQHNLTSWDHHHFSPSAGNNHHLPGTTLNDCCTSGELDLQSTAVPPPPPQPPLPPSSLLQQHHQQPLNPHQPLPSPSQPYSYHAAPQMPQIADMMSNSIVSTNTPNNPGCFVNIAQSNQYYNQSHNLYEPQPYYQTEPTLEESNVI